MKNKKVLITDTEWFESGPLKNPISAFDHELEKYDPTLYCLDYDTRLLATDPPTKAEKEYIRGCGLHLASLNLSRSAWEGTPENVRVM